MKFLTVLLFSNEDDLVEDQVKYYSHSETDLKVYIHNGSEGVKEKFKSLGIDFEIIPSSVNFLQNKVHEYIYSEIKKVEKNYDWIIFPESDEFLEGPDRKKSLHEYLEICDSEIIIFENYVFWFTKDDNMEIESPVDRIKYYSIRPKHSDRVYAWKSGHTSVERKYSHTHKSDRLKKTTTWKSRHYEIRSNENLIS